MRPTRSQLESYDAQPLLDIATGFKRLGPQVENLFKRYVTTISAPDWKGLASEAAHARAVGDRKTAYEMVDRLEKAASRLEQGYWDVSTPLKSARNLITSAEAAGFSVWQNLFVNVGPGQQWTPEVESARARWEQRILRAVDTLVAEDTRLQQDLSSLAASMKAEFEAIGRSQTTREETRFTDAERFIFEEMKRNLDSDTVKTIREMLRQSEWWEFGRDKGAGSRYLTALAMWAEKVATGRDWDHKGDLRELFGLKSEGTPKGAPGDDRYFQQPGTNRRVLFDIYSNMHYGYVGRAAGIDSETLIKAASIGEKGTGKDDAGDQITMRAGMELYEKYGSGMTEEQFRQAARATVDKLVTAKVEGHEIPQIAYK
ncbi:polymorphic toxin type 44 domain-containing protein [Nocardia transvalensis]|uniref:polymorphic toxin type 44 domain-containing protein n=1 Tax=Nocardia transvalensis TaxID=37333 RepID=UPI0018931EDB|nr:polymorphic toxin type 44 domain-containing protein [Nocardia transvalensis]MBF6332154.1 hypothetical protein [Nocardia transvalensis]